MHNSPKNLAIEVQFRTSSMQIWAETVEVFSQALGMNVKRDGDGPMFDFLRVVSAIHWYQETTTTLPQETINMYSEVRDEASRLIAARSKLLEEEVQSGQTELPT